MSFFKKLKESFDTAREQAKQNMEDTRKRIQEQQERLELAKKQLTEIKRKTDIEDDDALKLRDCEREAQLREMPEETMSVYQAAKPEQESVKTDMIPLGKGDTFDLAPDTHFRSSNEHTIDSMSEQTTAPQADGAQFSARMEMLINSALQDGVLTDKEREILKRRAEKEGEDWDEVEMIIDARLAEIQAEKGSATIASPAAPIAAPKLSEGQEVKAEQEELPAEPINFKRDSDNNKPSLVIPEGVTVIDERACSCFDKLQSVTLPSTLTTIEESAFAKCKKLEVIDFTKCSQLRSIGENAFYKSGLTNVVLPASVEEIGSKAFSDCEKLTKVDLSPCSQLRSIGENAFYKSGLTNVVLPASVEEIGSGAFEFCDKLEVIDFTRCSQLRSIGENAFYGSGLTNVVLPASVEEIVSTVFRYCEKLKKVDLSACIKLTSIADEAFRSCEKLSDVILPDSITHIGDSAFSGCPLKSIVLPASIEEMGEDVFEYCTRDLDSIDMSKVTKLKTIRRGFYGTETTIIPQGVVEVEDNALRNYGEKLFLPPTLKTFGKSNGSWESIYLFAPIFDQLDVLLTDNNQLYVLPQHLSAYRDLWDALGKPNERAEILPMPDEYQYYYDN